MTKKLVMGFIILFITLWFPIIVKAEDGDLQIQEQLIDDISLESVEEYWENIGSEYGGYLPEVDRTSLKDFIEIQTVFPLNKFSEGLWIFCFMN